MKGREQIERALLKAATAAAMLEEANRVFGDYDLDAEIVTDIVKAHKEYRVRFYGQPGDLIDMADEAGLELEMVVKGDRCTDTIVANGCPMFISWVKTEKEEKGEKE